MLEIELPHPGINTDKDRRFTYLNKDGIWSEIGKYFDGLGIFAYNYPLAADVCAGDGSVAALLVGRGSSPKDIYCFDKARTLSPLVKRVNWRYWNLYNLGVAIRGGEQLPRNIEKLKGFFDFVAMAQSFGVYEYAHEVCGFLVRAGGIVYSSGISLNRGHPESWIKEDNSHLMRKVG